MSKRYKTVQEMADDISDYKYKWWEKIQNLYWQIWPHDYRPGQIWYRTKCFFWHRYTTVKPRTLKFNTWVDRDHLLAHTMFEILSRFYEEEKDNVVWKYNCEYMGDGKFITINGKEQYVIDIIESLYNWWNDIYLPASKEYWYSCDILGQDWLKRPWNRDATEEELVLLRATWELEEEFNNTLIQQMKLLCEVSPHLWT